MSVLDTTLTGEYKVAITLRSPPTEGFLLFFSSSSYVHVGCECVCMCACV
jgi:hypothetical protein